MPVSFLLGLDSKIDEFSWVKPALTPSRLVYIGLRDVDAGEKRILRENGIKAFSMHEVDKYGIGRVVEMALDHVNPGRTLPIHARDLRADKDLPINTQHNLNLRPCPLATTAMRLETPHLPPTPHHTRTPTASTTSTPRCASSTASRCACACGRWYISGV